MPPTPSPCGSWRSPIGAHMLAEKSIGIGGAAVDGDDLYWMELRPTDQGRYVLVRRDASGHVADVTGAPHNVRTRVHEYGGGAVTVRDGVVWYSNVADGRLYRLDPGGTPRAITREGSLRYADFVYDPRRDRIVAVREDHEHLAVSRTAGADDRPAEAVNTIVALPASAAGEQTVLAQGADFYAAPRLSPDGAQLCWLSWNHPHMPWDVTELWVADLDGAGTPSNVRLVAGGDGESVLEPQWSPDGVLHFVSDRTGWWNIHRWTPGSGVEALTAERAEFAGPSWQFRMSHYAFDGPARIVATYVVEGMSRLGVVDTVARTLTPVPVPFSHISPSIAVRDGHAYVAAASPATLLALVDVDTATGEHEVVRSSASVAIGSTYISLFEVVESPTEKGRTAYAFFYPPRNPEHSIPEGELPPLLVRTHDGPTAHTPAMLSLDTQYWTTRGFAVLDVNYGGSSGYGREYRQRLDGAWGIVDVEDCVNGALHLVRQGRVDGARLAIDGGSAGGYTTLAVLTFRDSFAAGTSFFGVADLELLARDTHKFESRYLDRLVGPYPQRLDLYRERSPIHHTDRLSRPIILFQGLEDRVVPPAQAEEMYEAVHAKGVPCALVTFEGEDHGFRKAESIVRTQDGELWFYSRIFGFDPAGAVERVPIENLPPG